MKKNGYFEITSVHRDDLKGHFTPEEIATLTDEDMRHIASEMADAYVDSQFWDDLRYCTRRVLDEREL